MESADDRRLRGVEDARALGVDPKPMREVLGCERAGASRRAGGSRSRAATARATSAVICCATSRLPVRTAMSSSVTMPTSCPPSTTGSRRIRWFTIKASGLLEIHVRLAGDHGRGRQRSMGDGVDGVRPARRSTRSRSVTIRRDDAVVHQHHRADVAVAHQRRDVVGGRAGGRRDDRLGHDFPNLHRG